MLPFTIPVATILQPLAFDGSLGGHCWVMSRWAVSIFHSTHLYVPRVSAFVCV
jgi:hypothetical protein